MLLHVVPGEHLEELIEILLDLLHRELALVDGVEPTLEERLGHLQPGFLDKVVAELEREEVVALARKLLGDLLVDELVEIGFRRHVAGRESHLEELLVQFGFGELADFGDLQRECGIDALQLVLLDLQHGSALRRILIEFVDVDLHLVADLLANERLALLLRQGDKAHIGIGHVHVAVIQRHAQRLVGSHLLGVDQTAEATQEVGAVVVVHLLVDLDAVVGHLILLRKVELDFGCFAELEDEVELLAVLEIEVALLVRRDHVAQIVDLLLLQVIESGVRRQPVRLLGQDALAVHLLDDAHGHHAGTETGDVGLATIVAQHLLDLLGIVGLADLHAEQRAAAFALFSYDLHNECFVFDFFFFVPRNRTTKIGK